MSKGKNAEKCLLSSLFANKKFPGRIIKRTK